MGYKLNTSKRNLELTARKIVESKEVEESWTLAKNTLLELDQMAKNLYKEKYKKKKLIKIEEHKNTTEEKKMKKDKETNILKKEKRKMRKKLKKMHSSNTKNNFTIEMARKELFKKYKQI